MEFYITLIEPYFSFAKNHRQIFDGWQDNGKDTFCKTLNYGGDKFDTEFMPMLLPVMHNFSRHLIAEGPTSSFGDKLGYLSSEDSKLMEIVSPASQSSESIRLR